MSTIDNWNNPQIISFDLLFDRYSINANFDAKTIENMLPVLEEFKQPAKIQLRAGFPPNPNTSPGRLFPKRMTTVTSNNTPNIIYKVFEHISESKGSCFMANTLRPPMAQLVQETISRRHLTEFGVAKKGLFPLFSKETISNLDEININKAFIVCVEKKDILSFIETREIIKKMNFDSQKRLAEQACTIPEETGLGDFTIYNIQRDAKKNLFYILDTEPLYGELLINKFGKGFEQNKTLSEKCTLKSCAKWGLSQFKRSCEDYNLEIFINTAQSHLEKFD